VIDRRVGRIKSQNSRGAGLFEIKVEERDGRTTMTWSKRDAWRDWASLSEGCYLLRTNMALFPIVILKNIPGVRGL